MYFFSIWQEKGSRTETVQKHQSTQPSGGKRQRSRHFKTSVTSSALPVQFKHVAEADLNSYLLTPIIDEENDPLALWKVHKINFPGLRKIASKYLCGPATSAPSKRLFREYSDLHSLVLKTRKRYSGFITKHLHL